MCCNRLFNLKTTSFISKNCYKMLFTMPTQYTTIRKPVRLITATKSFNSGGRLYSHLTKSQQHLTTKKKMTKLTEQERTELLQPLINVGWAMVKDRDAIYKEYLFSDFNQAFSFMAGVALLAEKTNHHPEWFNVYNKVQVTMSTHDVGGLSNKDIRMAKYMEEQAKRFLV